MQTRGARFGFVRDGIQFLQRPYIRTHVNDFQLKKAEELTQKLDLKRASRDFGKNEERRRKLRKNEGLQRVISDPKVKEYMLKLQRASSSNITTILNDAVANGIKEPSIFLMGMKQFDKHRSSTEAFKVFHQMKTQTIDPSLECYSQYFRLCGKIEAYSKAIDEFQIMKEKKVAPNTPVMTSLIESFAALKKLPELLKDFDSHGLEKNVIFYTSLLKTCIRIGDVDTALDILQEMESNKIEINEITATVLMRVFKSHGDVTLAKKWYHELQYRIQPCIQFSSTYLSILADHGKIDEVTQLYHDMESAKLTDKMVINIVADAFANAGDLCGVEELFQKHQYSVEIFTSLMKALYKTGNIHSIEDYLKSHPNFLDDRQAQYAIFSHLLSYGDMGFLDRIYDNYFGPQKIPFGSVDNKILWEFHQYPFSIVVPCIRYGSRSIDDEEWYIMNVGRGKHLRKGTQSLRDHILNSCLFSDLEFRTLENPGFLDFRKIWR